jgi:hypothetical protein
MEDRTMLLNLVVLFNALQNRSRRRRDPFADPLDGPEWEGFRWIVPLIAWLVAPKGGRRARARQETGEQDEPVRDRSRSSAAARDAGIPGSAAC